MCSVVRCDSWRRGAQRFKLPEDPEKRLEWVQFLFEVNGQRLKESSWTDIAVCSEHFTSGCFENPAPTGTVQLQPGAVPSLCIKSEPDEPEPYQVIIKCEEQEETQEVASQSDYIKTRDSPSSYSEETEQSSLADPVSPVRSDTSDAFMYDYGQMVQKVVNIDMIREKVALLQTKGRYVVNEKRLLRLFSRKCPSCGSKVKMEKVVHGVLMVLNQQCLQCEYRNQWKSQVNASVPTAEQLTGDTEVTSETVLIDDDSSVTGASASDEEGDPMEETEESSDQSNMDSDEEWDPTVEFLQTNELHNESDEESEDVEPEEDSDNPSPAPPHTQLCTECGKFFVKRKPHACEHKIKPYSCNICGKRCATEIALNCHSRIHDENYEHPCKYCHITFKTKLDKITHEQVHLTESRPYKCPECSETFATNKQRRVHLKVHGGPKLLKCHICGMEFYRTLSLQRHLAVHTGEKPFQCSVCERGFNQAGHLKSHMRLHTGERPFKCKHCDKCFNHNVSLKSHVERYHTSSSKRERKRGKISKTSGDAQENGAESGLDNTEEEHDEEENVKKQRPTKPKRKRKSTGRPKGRPKRNASVSVVPKEETQDPGSNTQTRKSKLQKLKRKRCVDEEAEDEPTGSDMSSNADNDTDFDPEEETEEEERCGSQDSGKKRETKTGKSKVQRLKRKRDEEK